MTSSPAGRYEYRFSESDAAAILRRAAELQRRASDVRRMTVSELEEAASTAGIEAIHVHQAATEMALRQSRRDRPSPLLGGPRTILFEVTLDGEIPVPAYEYVIDAVRRQTGELGVASLIGRSLTWTALPSHGRAGPGWSRNIALTIVPQNGRTRIRIEEKLDRLVAGVFGAVLGGGGGGVSLLASLPLLALGWPATIPVSIIACVGGGWAAARRVYRKRVEQRQDELHGALMAIIEITQESLRARRALGPQVVAS
ncbi:hypothetical protein G6O69_20650 [Pseudenhygromyxa sp. WMMC2535]|uniref:hypothetical protein n=1 Tax=Pseudenhygromyxa sp. WMMC2535 TaxID=2712867 RepID=UPI0015537DC6|nr:hypothetical protein [Pseudenhygromyxa sp. WMMC2535]NVB40265.1 hypothetical protein [Pseudenhygromyxa sp. WMMC2535]